MFGFLKKKSGKDGRDVIGAPVTGKAIPLSEVNDPTFSEEMLGKGMAVIPAEGKIYAPADGVINMIFDTMHAVSMTTDLGAEILIHVGLDTVKMNGEGFKSHIKSGKHVKKGTLLLEFDLDKVKAAGYDPVTPVLICNSGDYSSVTGVAGRDVYRGDDVIFIEK